MMRNALPPETYEEVQKNFPATELVAGKKNYGSNERYDLQVYQTLEAQFLSPVWKEFIRQNVQEEVLKSFVQVFGEQVRAIYPDFEEKFGPLESLRMGLKGIHTHKDVDVILDFNTSINTPVIGKATRARRVHVDKTNKLFAGLFYLKDKEDESHGGDLFLYRFKKGVPFFRGTNVFDEDVEEAVSVPYTPNTFLIFLNGPRALHGVTPRESGPYTRRFVYFSASMKSSLYDISQYQMSRTDYYKRRLFSAVPSIPTLRGYSNDF